MTNLKTTVLDADWVYSSGENCSGLARGALMERCIPARKYNHRNLRIRRSRHRELVAEMQRICVGMLAVCALLAAMALLVG